MTPTDEVLVGRAQAGDHAAFEELVRRHTGGVYGLVLPFCQDRHEAEDLVQEVFLRAWRALGRFEGRSRFFTWLYRIAVNEAKRRVERRPSPERSLDDEPIAEAPDWSRAPELVAEQGAVREVLRTAIGNLPTDHRAALVLRDLQGLSSAEAADVLDVGEAALKSRLHRARMAVRRTLDEHFAAGLPDRADQPGGSG